MARKPRPWEQEPVPAEVLERIMQDFLPLRGKRMGPKWEFAPERQEAFLEELLKSGHRIRAAHAAGGTVRQVNMWLKDNPAEAEVFAKAEAEVMDTFHANELLGYEARARDGYEVPIMHEGTQVGTKQCFETQLAIMRMKKLDPGYRERSTVDVNVKTSGVLVVPAPVTSIDAWKQLVATAAKPTEKTN